MDTKFIYWSFTAVGFEQLSNSNIKLVDEEWLPIKQLST